MPEIIKKYIQEPGLVSSISQQVVTVTLLGSGGCASCHKSLCILRDTTNRSVEVPTTAGKLHVGDEVYVRMKPETGYVAIMWLYIIPFLVLMTVMIGLLRMQVNEGLVGLFALLALFPYYGILFLLRNYVKRQCHVEVVKR